MNNMQASNRTPNTTTAPTTLAATGLVERARVEFLVPLTDNQQRQFPHEYFRALDQFLLRLSHGFTDTGAARGAWINFERQPVFDTSLKYQVTCMVETAPHVAATVESLVKTLFTQDAVCIDVVPMFTSAY